MIGRIKTWFIYDAVSRNHRQSYISVVILSPICKSGLGYPYPYPYLEFTSTSSRLLAQYLDAFCVVQSVCLELPDKNKVFQGILSFHSITLESNHDVFQEFVKAQFLCILFILDTYIWHGIQ